MRYSIDTSAILEGWKRHDPPDVFPGLWTKVDQLIALGDLIASEEVLEELRRQDDDVFAWASKRPAMFCAIDERIQLAVADLLRAHPRLVDTRRHRSGADPFVIALASIERCTVVTAEPGTGRLHRPNIPDVCAAAGIPCVTLLQLFREQRWVF